MPGFYLSKQEYYILSYATFLWGISQWWTLADRHIMSRFRNTAASEPEVDENASDPVDTPPVEAVAGNT